MIQAFDREVLNETERAWNVAFGKSATVVGLRRLMLDGLKGWNVVVGLSWILDEMYSVKVAVTID